VWQRKGLPTAKNEFLALFSDVWQGKDLRNACSSESETVAEPGRSGRYPHPRYFGKRGCKLLKTKEGYRKKRGKRVQGAANTWKHKR
jgi:hypothetical protein